MKNLVSILFVLSFSLARSQDVTTAKLAWSVIQLTDLNANVVESYKCVFKTNGDKAIMWLQNNETFQTEFKIEAMRGTWADVNKDGSIVYSISTDGLEGSLTFKHLGNSITITLDLEQESGNNLRHKYTVSSITPFN